MSPTSQAIEPFVLRLNTGLLATLGLAGAATLAALGIWVSFQWGLGVLGTAILLLVLVRFPRLFVYLYLGIDLLPYSLLKYLDEFRLFGASEQSVNMVGLAWVLSLVVFAMYSVWKKKHWWKVQYYRSSFLLLGLALAGAVVAEDKAFGIRDWVHLAAPICLSLVLYSTIKNRAEAIQTIRHIFLLFAVVMAFGFYQLVNGTGSYDVVTESYRLSGIYGEGGEVTYAVLLLYLACLVAPLAIAKISETKLTSGAVLIASTFLLLASQSRGPLLGLMCAGVVMLSKSVLKVKYWLLLLALILFAAQLSPRVYSRFGGPLLSAPTKFWQDQGISANATQRMATWAMLYLEFADRKTLLTGRGFGFSDNYLLNGMDDPGNFYAHAVHNEYLRFLIDLGFLGPLLLIAQLVVLYRAGSRLAARARDSLVRSFGTSLCGMVAAFAVVATTSNMFGAAAQYDIFWMFTGVILAATQWSELNVTGRLPAMSQAS